jgi:two-component system, NtrC family, sensor histidine kinase HydH
MMRRTRLAMKKPRLLSISVALVLFVALSGLSVLVFRGLSDSRRLVSQNETERTFSTLLAGLRFYEDFGSAIEATPYLAGTVLGVGLYNHNGALLYHWGDVPKSYAPPPLVESNVPQDMARAYLDNARNGSAILLLQPLGDVPPPPQQGDHAPRGSSFMSETLSKARLIYLEVHQPQYWRWIRLRTVLFPVTEVVLAVLVFFVRLLVVRNRDYRQRIEQQKNLVTLGTAASTLAHEIKNPLLSIRLQASILALTTPPGTRQEIEIIESEVERLSQLSNRVNDFLRDPAGIPARTDVRAVASEVNLRMRGKPLAGGEPASAAAVPEGGGTGPTVMMDPERLRSIMENLLRNALESGGREDDVQIGISRADGVVSIDVLDRGSGLPAGEQERIFDPFFTTKSRGTGIGLAICSKFVAAANGTISVRDRDGGGVKARVALPEAAP